MGSGDWERTSAVLRVLSTIMVPKMKTVNRSRAVQVLLRNRAMVEPEQDDDVKESGGTNSPLGGVCMYIYVCIWLCARVRSCACTVVPDSVFLFPDTPFLFF